MRFRIRAQWWGPDGAQTGVADDTVEGSDACVVLEDALPGSWCDGQYTHATVTIAPVETEADQEATGKGS